MRGPGAEISLVLEENANPIGKDWQEQGLERQKETKPCKTLKPTVMQILWKVKEDFKQQGHHVCVYSRLLAIVEDDGTVAHSFMPGLEQKRQENAGTSGL